MKDRPITEGPRVGATTTRSASASDATAPTTPRGYVPDTDPHPPLTPSSDHISVDIQSPQPVGAPVATQRSDDAPSPGLQPAPARELRADRLSSASHQKYSVQRADTPTPDGGGSNTTLQSMMRPELLQAAVSDTRRFQRIENDLDDQSVTLRLLEKRAQSAETTARIALGVAALALALMLLRVLL